MPTLVPGSRPALNPAEEIRLIAGAKHGDHASFEALVDHYMGSALAVAMNYTGNRDDALELVQEGFYRVFKSLDRFHEGERFAPWFFRILRNACLNFLQRRRQRRSLSIHAAEPDSDDLPLPDGALSPLGVTERGEEQRQLLHAMARLSVKHREIIILRHFQDLDYQGIADVLEIPIGTVMSRLFHARQRLKVELEPYMEAKA